MPKSLPTQRTLARLRQEGALEVAIVEHWNPHARIRQDLFGFIDILAIACKARWQTKGMGAVYSGRDV